MNSLSHLPQKSELLEWFKDRNQNPYYSVNNHIHTPYSFSAFEDVDQAVRLAREQNLHVLGINDFFVTDGYEAFAEKCREYNIFPLFNIEFIGLEPEKQQQNIRLNDPNNPGRTYFTGKALKFPAQFDPDDEKKIHSVKQETQKQVSAMMDKVNTLLKAIEPGFELSMDEIYEKYAKNLVRERHIAKLLRIKALEYFKEKDKIMDFFTRLFDGTSPVSSPDDAAAFENEIRSRLLKAGGKAFVPENENAFLNVHEIKNIIIRAGGIPTYPLLLDDNNGNYTEYESDKEALLTELDKNGVYSIEFIPQRNDIRHLQEYVSYFYEKGFLVTYGTEHNTPKLTTMIVECRNNKALTEELSRTGINGAAVMAAHQYLLAKGEEGYIKENGMAKYEMREEFEKLGKAVIDYYLHQS